MKNIDFLPDIYRQRAALRQARVWWCLVVLLLLVQATRGFFGRSEVRRLLGPAAGVLRPLAYAAMIIAVVIFDQSAKAFVYFQF